MVWIWIGLLQIITQPELWKAVVVSQNSGWMSLHAHMLFLADWRWLSAVYNQLRSPETTQELFQEPKIQQRKKNSRPTTTSCSEQLQALDSARWLRNRRRSGSQALRPSRFEPTVLWDRAEGPPGLRQRPPVWPRSLLEVHSCSSIYEGCCSWC